jgi:alpha-L-fucosidase
VRGIGHSFGYNAAETDADHLTGEELVELFLKVVGAGGNLLINIGPAADGSVPPLQAKALGALGAFLKVHGDAIHGTRPWRALAPVETGGAHILPVAKGSRHFALVAGKAQGEVALAGWAGIEAVRTMSGADCPVRRSGDTLVLALPPGGASVLELLPGSLL